MFDADGIFYFEGLNDENYSFNPKDWFGENYGYIKIQYYQPEKKKFIAL